MRLITSVLTAAVVILVACCSAMAEDARPMLLPTPKKVEWKAGGVKLSSTARPLACIVYEGGDKAIVTGIKQVNNRLKELGVAALPIVKDSSGADRSLALIWITDESSPNVDSAQRKTNALPAEANVADGYVLRCKEICGQDVIWCLGHDARACYYGLQTLIQLMSASDGVVGIPKVDIVDWPTFKLRLVKTGPCADPPERVRRWVDMMPRYKASVIAAQYQPRVERGGGTWDKPSKSFLEGAEIVARAGRENGTYDPFLYLGPFGKGRKLLTDPNLLDEYVEKLLHWASQGYTWIGIDINDWLMEKDLTQEEREKIGDLGDCWTLLTNAAYKGVRAKYPNVGFVVCPSAGHYKNATPEVIKFCKSIPQDILVISAGAAVKADDYSGPVKAEFLKDWAEKTGRKPIFWDNCLYRQLDHYAPFINRIYNFDSYANRFPPNFAELLGGPGIHLNCGPKRWWEPGVLTFLDYCWNPDAYDAEKSLRKARVMLWGEAAADAAEVAQKTTAEFYGYLYAVHNDPAKGNLADAEAKFVTVQTAVDKLKALLEGPEIKEELDTQCLATAKTKMRQTFAPPKARKPKNAVENAK